MTTSAVEATARITIDPSKQSELILLLLASFLITFLLTRFWVRMQRSGPAWWPKSLKTGDTHVHHLVPGIFLVLISGFLGIATHPGSPGVQLIAIAFGAGAALTLDEYALWLHLDDVYWAEEGRQSVDVIVVALFFGLFVLIGSSPFGAGKGEGGWLLAFTVLVDMVGVTLSALKGKGYMAGFGVFVPGVGLIGGFRAARPGSWWANRFYPRHPDRLEKGSRRFERWSSRRTRWWDAIGGQHGDRPGQG